MNSDKAESSVAIIMRPLWNMGVFDCKRKKTKSNKIDKKKKDKQSEQK